MDGDSWLQIIFLIVFVFGGAYFGAAETSYSAMNKIRVKSLADDGNRQAKQAIYISNNFDNALTTILIGTNIMEILFSTFATILALKLFGESSVTYVTIVATIIVFIFSEILPKSYAQDNSDSVAINISSSLRFFMRIFHPFVVIFTKISNFITNLLGIKAAPEITEEDFNEVIETMSEEKTLDPSKQKLVDSALIFSRKTVTSVLTTLDNMVMIDINTTNNQLAEMIKAKPFSRIPVYENSRDNIVGILQTKSFLRGYLKNHDYSIRDAMSVVLKIRESMILDDILREMSRKKSHMAIVVSSEGKVTGVVTIEDILEELVGDLGIDSDSKLPGFRKITNNQYEVDGNILIRDVLIQFGHQYELNSMLDVASWCTNQLSNDVAENSKFIYMIFSFTIKTVEKGIIKKVIIQK